VGFALEGCHESNFGNKAVSFFSLKIVFVTFFFSFIITREIAVSFIELNVLGKDKLLVDIPDELDEKEKRKFIRKILQRHSEKNPILRKFHPDTKKMAIDMAVETVITQLNSMK
jgi:hypothetical protein